MDETVAVMKQRLATEQEPTKKKRLMLGGDTEYRLYVSKNREKIEKDTCHVVKTYMSLKAKQFIRTGKLAEAIKDRKMQFEELDFVLKDALIPYLHAIGSDVHTTFVNLLKELLGVDRIWGALQSQIRIYFYRSADISGMY